MKKLFLICLLSTYYFSMGQSRLDSLIFDKVNEYRIENCLPAIKWSNSAYKVAENQAEYISLVGSPYHDQIDSFPGFFPDSSFINRFEKYGICQSRDHVFGENLVVVPDTSINKNLPLEEIANVAIEAWKNSPEHNELLLYPIINYGAISNRSGDKEVEFVFDPFTLSGHSIIEKGYNFYFISLDVYR